MKKKKIELIIIIIAALMIVLGMYFLNHFNAERLSEDDTTADITITQSKEHNQENFNISQEDETETEVQEEKTVFVLKDEGVLENSAFDAFINNEILAYDDTENKNRYMHEYFAGYGIIYSIHYMAEDLNQDAKNELLILIQYGSYGSYGDMLVFEESENGELIAWEKWQYITSDRQSHLYYCDNGIFKAGGGGLGISVGHYTQEGSPERLLDWYHTITESNDSYYVVNITLYLYENGVVTKSLSFDEYYDTETDKELTEFETDEAREGRRIYDEIVASLEDEKEITIYGAEYTDKVETILLEELEEIQ